MDDVEHELIQAWRRCSLASPPYLLPGDEAVLPQETLTVHQLSHVDPHPPAIHSTDTTLHVGLLPAPYNGNLIHASIFILMLNPGLAPGDYPAEYAAHDYRATAIRQLRQDNGGDDYPFLFLDPSFKWHPGFTYWQKRGFRELAERLAAKDRIPLNSAFSRLSQAISCLQLVPYHSKTLKMPDRIVDGLVSSQLARRFVHDVLVPRAQRDEAVIIAARGVRWWGLPTHNNILTYGSGETRGAYLTLASRGGRVIAGRLGL